MKNWISKNYKTLIIAAFLVPIITVAIVSISHVTTWYGISNPVSWALYLSIGIEIAALSALAAISANMGKKVYFPFAIVTLVQFIGNIFFAYSYIDINSQSFKDWVDLVSPLVSFMGVEATDFVGHKRFLALFAGGMLPMISLSFLHMLVKFTEEDRNKEEKTPSVDKQIQDNITKADLADESARLRLTERDLEILQRYLENPPEPNDALKAAAKKHLESVEKIIEEQPEVKNHPTKEEQAELIAEIMKNDQELGLYDEPFDNPLVKEKTQLQKLEDYIKQEEEQEDWGGLSNDELIGDDEILSTIAPTVEEESENFSTIDPTSEIIFQDNEITPALSDEEVREMFMDEWERKFDNVEEEPTQKDEELNFNNTVSEESVEDSGEFDGFVPEPFATPEEVQKYNIDNSIPVEEEFREINNDSFWRDHIQEDEDDDLKKKS